MKNTYLNLKLSDRSGQIPIGLIAIVVGGILVSVMAGVALKSGTNAIQKASVAREAATGCSELNPEQCAADELKKNQEAEAAKSASGNPIVGADEQLKDAVAEAPGVDTTLKEVGLSPIGGIPERLPAQGKEGVLSWLELPIIKRPWEFLNFVVEGVMSGTESAYNGIKSAYNNFWAPLPIEPIDLASVPSDAPPAPVAPKSNCVQSGSGDLDAIAYVNCVNNEKSIADEAGAGAAGSSAGGGGTTEAPKPVTSGGGSGAPAYCFSSESFKEKLGAYLSKIRIYEIKKRAVSAFKIITDSNQAAYEKASSEFSAALSEAYLAFEAATTAYEESLSTCKSPASPQNAQVQTCVGNYETTISQCDDSDGRCVVDATENLASECFNYTN